MSYKTASTTSIRNPPAHPVLRTVSSTSSLRLGLNACSSNSIDIIIPTFADTTARWTGSPQSSSVHSWSSQDLDKQSTDTMKASTSGSTSRGLEYRPASSPDLEDNILPTDWEHTPVKRPQRAVLVRSDSSGSGSSLSSILPVQRSKRRQSVKTRRKEQSASAVESDEELERELMEDHYSSMEQMLAKNGFEKCRVCTPPTTKSSATPDNTGDTTILCSHPLSQTITNITSTSASTSKEAVNNYASSSLRAKTSILSFSGLVSSLWGNAPSTSASKAVEPSPVKRSSSPNSVEGLDDDRKETIRGWVAQTAAAALDSMPYGTLRKLKIVEDGGEPSAESLLREEGLRHTVSDGSIPQSKVDKRPSLASIFGSTIPAAINNTANITQTVSTSSSSPANSSIQEPTKTVPAAHPEPRILRKTASQHTLRMAASPVLSKPEVSMPVSTSTTPPPSSSTTASVSASPPAPAAPAQHTPVKRLNSVRAPLPRSIVRDGLPRSDSSPGLTSSGTPERSSSPRYIAHRNPRDSPIGETRVLKGAPPPLTRRITLQQELPESPARKSNKGSKGPSILDGAEDNEGLWTPPRRSAANNSSNVLKPLSPLSNNIKKQQQPSSLQAERPKLRAKESLEHILAIRQRQEEQAEQAKASAIKAKTLLLGEEKRAKEEIQKRQQSTAGRKALAQLSSFHRSPLPIAKDASSSNQQIQGRPEQSGPKKMERSASDGSKVTFSGTLRGLFDSAMDWIAEDSDVPFPIHTQKNHNTTYSANSATLPSRGRAVKQRPSLSNMDNRGRRDDVLNLRGVERRKKAASMEEQQRRSKIQTQTREELQKNVPTIVIHEPTPTRHVNDLRAGI